MEYDLWQASPGNLKDFQSHVQPLQSYACKTLAGGLEL